MLRSNAKDGEFDILASGLPLSEGESVEVTWGLAAWMLRRARLKAGAAHGWAVPAFFIFTNNSLDGNAYHFYGTIIARGMALHSPHADLWIGSGRILLWLRSCLSINRRRRVGFPCRNSASPGRWPRTSPASKVELVARSCSHGRSHCQAQSCCPASCSPSVALW